MNSMLVLNCFQLSNGDCFSFRSMPKFRNSELRAGCPNLGQTTLTDIFTSGNKRKPAIVPGIRNGKPVKPYGTPPFSNIQSSATQKLSLKNL